MFYFRADSNATIAGGHIMRCIAIASVLVNNGEQVCFLTADDNPGQVLRESKLPFIDLGTDWRDLMPEVDKVRSILEKDYDPFLLIDTYQVTREYVEALKPYCKVGYLGSKQEYLGDLDLLINYSTDIDYDFYSNNYLRQTEMLLGPAYAPLRREFWDCSLTNKDNVSRILITTGNTDKYKMVPLIIDGLSALIKERSIVLDVVMGRLFDNKKELHDKYDNDPQVTLHENVKSMSSLMKECDLAVTANGTTVYELAAVGLPIISFAMVEEQVKSAESLSALGVIDYCGKSYINIEESISNIIEKVQYYIDNIEERHNLAVKAHMVVDGQGCQRIIQKMLAIRKE